MATVDDGIPHPGDVRDIGSQQVKDAIVQNLDRIIHSGHGYLGKDVFYLHGHWETVSETSHQTSGELKLLHDNLDEIVGTIGDRIVELGPGYAATLH